MNAAEPASEVPEEEEEEAENDDEDEEETDDDEETDEESEEEEEPKLKYQRLGASVSEILKSETNSCLVAHEKFLVTNA